MTLGNNREFRRIILQNRYKDSSFVDEVIKPKTNSFNIFNEEDETLKIALPIATVLGLLVILP